MKTKHTRGRWKIENKFGMLPTGIITRNQHICSFYNCNMKNREANARLIAAAPDLLSSLKSVLEELYWVTTDYDGQLREMDWYKSAKEAIKKATDEN